jgi:hypothetical protein
LLPPLFRCSSSFPTSIHFIEPPHAAAVLTLLAVRLYCDT